MLTKSIENNDSIFYIRKKRGTPAVCGLVSWRDSNTRMLIKRKLKKFETIRILELSKVIASVVDYKTKSKSRISRKLFLKMNGLRFTEMMKI
ncbi:MAG: hypothetical protein ACFFFC_17990 [Candidatus Thorarchaeota archaeon]